MKRIVVLGAGPSGLSAAWQIGRSLDAKIDVYEKSARVGGVCGYYDFNGLRLDYGPHKIYSLIPGIMEVFQGLAGRRVKEHKKRHKLIIRGKILNYPVRVSDACRVFTLPEIAELIGSITISLLKSPFAKAAASYEEYCLSVFGSKLYKEVFAPLAEKIWGDPGRLSAEIARRRIPTKSPWELIFNAAGIKKDSAGNNADIILYPRKGFYDICECMAEEILKKGGGIHTGLKPARIERGKDRVTGIVFDDKSRCDADILISSIPLKELIRLLAFDDITAEGNGGFVRMRNAVIVYLIIDKPKVIDEHWIFCSDRDILFSRIAEQKLFFGRDFMGERTALSCDFTCDDDSPAWRMDDPEIVKRCALGLAKLKLIKPGDVLDSRVVKIPEFYPVYENDFEEKLNDLIGKVNRMKNVISTGRLGLCNYNNIDHCLDMGMAIAQGLVKGGCPADINLELHRKSHAYRIVD